MIIGTVHVDCDATADFVNVTEKVKSVFHSHGIHSSTIQPEFHQEAPQSNGCVANCAAECAEEWCCMEELNQPESRRRKPTNPSSPQISSTILINN